MVLTQAGIKFKKMNKRFSILIALLLLTCCGTNAPKSNVAATLNHNPPPQKVYAKQMKLFKQKKVFPKMGYICVEKKTHHGNTWQRYNRKMYNTTFNG